MALGDARKCFTEPWYPALPNRKGLIQAAPALARFRLLLCVHRVCPPFPWIWRWFDPHQQVSQGIQEKNFPRGWEKGHGQVAVTPSLISWFQISITGAYLFVGKGTNFFIMSEDFWSMWGFFSNFLFFSLRKKIRETERDFAQLGIVGVVEWLFLPGYVNGKMPLLRGALESSSVLFLQKLVLIYISWPVCALRCWCEITVYFLP